MAEPFIHLSGVRKLYRRRDAEYLAISDASFDVMPGELVALVDPFCNAILAFAESHPS